MASTCCCCLKLETGGYIIAGLQLLGCIIGLIVFSILVLMETAQSIRSGSCKDCPPLDIVLIGVCVAAILLFIWFAYIALRCITGIDKRDHSKVRPMMILLGVGLAIAAIQFIFTILTLNLQIIFSGLVAVALNGYQYSIIYQLYQEFQYEFESRGDNSRNAHYQTHGKVEFIA